MRSLPKRQLGCVALDPSPDGGVVDVDAALGQQFLDFAVRQAVTEIPTDGANDDLGFKLPPLACLSGYQRGHQIFATLRRFNGTVLDGGAGDGTADTGAQPSECTAQNQYSAHV